MMQEICTYAQRHRNLIYKLLRRYFALDKRFLLQSELRKELIDIQDETEIHESTINTLENFVANLQEGIFQAPWAYFSIRQGIARIAYLRIHHDHLAPEEVSTADYLKFKEQQVQRDGDDPVLEIDFGPFGREL